MADYWLYKNIQYYLLIANYNNKLHIRQLYIFFNQKQTIYKAFYTIKADAWGEGGLEDFKLRAFILSALIILFIYLDKSK